MEQWVETVKGKRPRTMRAVETCRRIWLELRSTFFFGYRAYQGHRHGERVAAIVACGATVLEAPFVSYVCLKKSAPVL